MVTNPFTALYTTLQLNTDFHALTPSPTQRKKSATPRLRGKKEGHSSGKGYGNKGRGPSMKQNVVPAEWIVRE